MSIKIKCPQCMIPNNVTERHPLAICKICLEKYKPKTKLGG